MSRTRGPAILDVDIDLSFMLVICTGICIGQQLIQIGKAVDKGNTEYSHCEENSGREDCMTTQCQLATKHRHWEIGRWGGQPFPAGGRETQDPEGSSDENFQELYKVSTSSESTYSPNMPCKSHPSCLASVINGHKYEILRIQFP
jgi:hypothetical protein